MWKDSIVEEVRRIREEYAEKFDNDLHSICEGLRKNQLSSGRMVVSRPSRRPVTAVPVQGANASPVRK